MPPRSRSCARCKKTLSKPRTAKRKKYCFSCEVDVRHESRDKAHDRRVVETYGIRPGEYLKLYEAQGGRCAICQRATGKTKKLAVDHDHKLGSTRESVRGLLCSTCNKMVGHSRDDPAFFLRAYDYLIRPPAREVLK